MQMHRPTEDIDDDDLYPADDGKPMTDNATHYRFTAYLFFNILRLFEHRRADVYAAANLLWYATRGRPGDRIGPDVMVAFGRPMAELISYRQWEQGGIAPQVVFEVLSPRNRLGEIEAKRRFYRRHGVEEYYEYNPRTNRLAIWLRTDGQFRRRRQRSHGFVSPRLGVRFDLSGPELRVFVEATGEPFLSHGELADLRRAEAEAAEAARRERDAQRERAEAAERERDAAQRERDALRELARRHGLALPGETP